MFPMFLGHVFDIFIWLLVQCFDIVPIWDKFSTFSNELWDTVSTFVQCPMSVGDRFQLSESFPESPGPQSPKSTSDGESRPAAHAQRTNGTNGWTPTLTNKWKNNVPFVNVQHFPMFHGHFSNIVPTTCRNAVQCFPGHFPSIFQCVAWQVSNISPRCPWPYLQHFWFCSMWQFPNMFTMLSRTSVRHFPMMYGTCFRYLSNMLWVKVSDTFQRFVGNLLDIIPMFPMIIVRHVPMIYGTQFRQFFKVVQDPFSIISNDFWDTCPTDFEMVLWGVWVDCAMIWEIVCNFETLEHCRKFTKGT